MKLQHPNPPEPPVITPPNNDVPDRSDPSRRNPDRRLPPERTPVPNEEPGRPPKRKIVHGGLGHEA